MVYSEKFIAVIKVNGKVLRENDDTVTLPFGSDYSLLLKNLEARRASAKVSIDGKDVLDGHALIINPNSEIELKGFIDNGAVRNAFRFIQKTSEISEHRGDNIDDGFIRIEFAFEKEKPIRTIIHDTIYYKGFNDRDIYGSSGSPPNRLREWKMSNGVSGQSVSSGMSANYVQDQRSRLRGVSNEPTANAFVNQTESNVVCDSLNDQPLQDEGITVKGVETSQNFRYVSIGELEEAKTIIIRLKGTTSKGVEVSKPITVKTKIECPTCGRKSKSHVKFCANCGTFIQ